MNEFGYVPGANVYTGFNPYGNNMSDMPNAGYGATTPSPIYNINARVDFRSAAGTAPYATAFASNGGFGEGFNPLLGLAGQALTSAIWGPGVVLPPFGGTQLNETDYLRAVHRQQILFDPRLNAAILGANPGLSRYGKMGQDAGVQTLYDLVSPGGSMRQAAATIFGRMGTSLGATFQEQYAKSIDLEEQLRSSFTDTTRRPDGTYNARRRWDKAFGFTDEQTISNIDEFRRFGFGGLTADKIAQSERGGFGKIASNVNRLARAGRSIFGKDISENELARQIDETVGRLDETSFDKGTAALQKIQSVSNALKVDSKTVAEYVKMMKQMYENIGLIGTSNTEVALNTLSNVQAVKDVVERKGGTVDLSKTVQIQWQAKADYLQSFNASNLLAVSAAFQSLTPDQKTVQTLNIDGKKMSVSQFESKIHDLNQRRLQGDETAQAQIDTLTAQAVSSGIVDENGQYTVSSQEFARAAVGIQKGNQVLIERGTKGMAGEVVNTGPLANQVDTIHRIMQNVDDMVKTRNPELGAKLDRIGGTRALTRNIVSDHFDDRDRFRAALKEQQDARIKELRQKGILESEIQSQVLSDKELDILTPQILTGVAISVGQNELYGVAGVEGSKDKFKAIQDNTRGDLDYKGQERKIRQDQVNSRILQSIGGKALEGIRGPDIGSKALEAFEVIMANHPELENNKTDKLKLLPQLLKEAGAEFLGVNELEVMRRWDRDEIVDPKTGLNKTQTLSHSTEVYEKAYNDYLKTSPNDFQGAKDAGEKKSNEFTNQVVSGIMEEGAKQVEALQKGTPEQDTTVKQKESADKAASTEKTTEKPAAPEKATAPGKSKGDKPASLDEEVGVLKRIETLLEKLVEQSKKSLAVDMSPATVKKNSQY